MKRPLHAPSAAARPAMFRPGRRGGPLRATCDALAERQSLLESVEKRLALALESTGDAVWEYRAGRRTYFSDGYYRMLGYSPDCDLFQAGNWLKMLHRDDRHAVESVVTEVGGGRTDLLAVEYRVRQASGDYKWVFLRGRVIARDAAGQAAHMIGTVQDLTSRRKAEAAALELQELFRNAFEESAIGMAMVTRDYRMVRVNDQFCRITGYSRDELRGMTIQDITHPDDIDADVNFFATIVRGERRHYALEKRYVRKDGRIVWVQLHVGVVLDATHTPAYLIGQVQDITDRKRADADLQAYAGRLVRTKEELERSTAELSVQTAEAVAARAAAEEAARAKSAFLANISHEIRTPMAAIVGFADMLRDPRLPDADRPGCCETIARQGQHLLALINDVLDLSKIDAGKMTVESISCDPRQLVNDVRAMTASRAADKRLPVAFRVADDVPRRVRSDPTRLRQVLLNLVSNAIKFTPAGGIDVEVTAARLAGGAAGLRFAVRDSGIGMSGTQIARLFEPFSQADASFTRRFGGTGLGLAITKRLVEMMNGTINVASRVGEGTRFEVRVEAPGCDAAPTTGGRTLPALRPGLRVLLAEDGPDNQRLISFYLSHAGASVTVAENGRVAVEAAVAARAAGTPFDLVLMDMQMPEMDGCQATLALRDNGIDAPVLALTAHGSADARSQSLRAGCLEHLVKPVAHDDLILAVARHASAGTGRLVSTLDVDARFAGVLAEYVARLPAQAAELGRLADPPGPPLRRLLHRIKGAGGGYGLPTLSDAAAAAIDALDGDDCGRLADRVDTLIGLMRSVRGYDRGRERTPCDSAC